MQYAMLIYQNWAHFSEDGLNLSEEERKEIGAEYAELGETSGVTPGLPLGLPENATTVRVIDGKTELTNGPFSEHGEVIGGWLVFEANDLDAALNLAARIPAARLGGAIEVRPVGEYW
jgi:hypothetical protein